MFEAVLAHLETVGPVHVEPVSVGILIKRVRTFAELRPRPDRVMLSVLLSRTVQHPRIAKRLRTSGRRVGHFVELRSPGDVDDDVRRWLTESYLDSPA